MTPAQSLGTGTDWRSTLGPFGVWESGRTFDPALAPELEALGYTALWLGSAHGDLEVVEQILDSTSRIIVATGIVSILTVQPRTLAESYHRVVEAHPGRFLLGVGVGHPERAPEKEWKPFTALPAFLAVVSGCFAAVADRAAGMSPVRLPSASSTASERYVEPERSDAEAETHAHGWTVALTIPRRAAIDAARDRFRHEHDGDPFGKRVSCNHHDRFRLVIGPGPVFSLERCGDD